MADYTINILKTHLDIVKPKADQTGGRYKQDRRNAYKIGAGGKYGDLVVHLPGLLTDHIMKAYKNGKQVMNRPVDDDTMDLLTKRFNTRKHYSDLSRKIFSDLNRLSEIPNHRSSMKFHLV